MSVGLPNPIPSDPPRVVERDGSAEPPREDCKSAVSNDGDWPKGLPYICLTSPSSGALVVIAIEAESVGLFGVVIEVVLAGGDVRGGEDELRDATSVLGDCVGWSANRIKINTQLL